MTSFSAMTYFPAYLDLFPDIFHPLIGFSMNHIHISSPIVLTFSRIPHYHHSEMTRCWPLGHFAQSFSSSNATYCHGHVLEEKNMSDALNLLLPHLLCLEEWTKLKLGHTLSWYSLVKLIQKCSEKVWNVSSPWCNPDITVYLRSYWWTWNLVPFSHCFSLCKNSILSSHLE